MNEPAGIGDVLQAIGLSGFLFLTSLFFLVAFVLKWRFLTPERKQMAWLLVFSFTLLFAWLMPWLYLTSILRTSWTDIPAWVPATAVAAEGIVTLVACRLAARERSRTRIEHDEQRRKGSGHGMNGVAE